MSSLSFSFPTYQPVSVGYLLTPCSRAFLLLEGTTFFLVAPAMGGNQTSLCTTNEKHDHGNASGGVLRQWRPSSLTTHRSSPSLSLSFPLSFPLSLSLSLSLNPSLVAHSSSPFLLLHPATCAMSSSLHESCLRFSSRARFFPLLLAYILIFFINFSQALQTILHLPRFLRFSISLLRDVRTRSSPYSAFPNPWSEALLRMRSRRPLSFSRTTDVFGPFAAGVAGVHPCPSARTSLARSPKRGFRVSHHRLLFPPRIFRR